MLVIVLIDVLIVATLVIVAIRRGLEEALPYFAFIITLIPDECRIALPGLFDLRAQRVAVIVLAILFLASRRKSQIRTVPLKRLMLVNLVWVLASTSVSIVFMTSVKQGVAQLIEYYFLYYIIVKTVTDVRTVTKIVAAMVAAMCLCSVLGLLEIYARWNLLSMFPLETQSIYGTLYLDAFDRGIRARSMFVHPIHFGAALAMVIPFAFYLLTSSSRGWLQKAFLNLSLVLMFWSLYKTGSRGPWVAAAVAMLILTIASESKIRKRVTRVAAFAGLLLILRPGITDTLVNMYDATFDPGSRMGSSFQYRPILLRTVLENLNDNPLRAVLGFGLGSFREKGLIVEMPAVGTYRSYTCDSTWILSWYETGYIGLIVFSALLLQPGFLALRSYRKLPRPDRSFSLVIVSSLTTFYVVMGSVAIYGWGQNGHMLWMIIAISIAYTSLKARDLSHRRTTHVEPCFLEADSRRTVGVLSLQEVMMTSTPAEQFSPGLQATDPLRRLQEGSFGRGSAIA